ncbi:MAG: stage V sporulation protein AC [Clostridia bacterium]|nr:stage V sporulation protein AC [Clostridia bacterium]
MNNDKKTAEHRRYDRMVKAMTPGSDDLHGYIRAFWVGGLICAIGQVLSLFGEKVLGLPEGSDGMFTSIALIFLGVLLTGLGVYDDIGRYAGAGSIVPITGFANSMAAPAIEFRREGLVLGVGAKLFTVAGPVLVYGLSASIAAGVAWWLIGGMA